MATFSICGQSVTTFFICDQRCFFKTWSHFQFMVSTILLSTIAQSLFNHVATPSMTGNKQKRSYTFNCQFSNRY